MTPGDDLPDVLKADMCEAAAVEMARQAGLHEQLADLTRRHAECLRAFAFEMQALAAQIEAP